MLQYKPDFKKSLADFAPTLPPSAGSGFSQWRQQQNAPETSSQVVRQGFFNLIGDSPQIAKVYQFIEQIAGADAAVLIEGETGSGKELVARAIHASSRRRQNAFVAVNCAALSETLLESELFGHERGAFTGALKQKSGRFELADGGTLFLDEISEIPAATQAKLLRALQEKAFERVGGTQIVKSNFRVIAATNQNLKAAVKNGRFREDLYFRLNVLPLNLPPLREREGDIAVLAHYFLQQFCERYNKSIEGISAEAVLLLERHAWPGNVRELRNIIERAVVLCDRKHLDAAALQALSDSVEASVLTRALALRMPEKELTRIYARLILDEQNGNKSATCDILGINYRTLINRLG